MVRSNCAMYREGAEDLEKRINNLESELAQTQQALSEAKNVRTAVLGTLLLVAGGIIGFGVASARSAVRTHYPQAAQPYRRASPIAVHIDDVRDEHGGLATPPSANNGQKTHVRSVGVGPSFSDQEQMIAKSRAFLVAAQKGDCASLSKLIHPGGLYLVDDDRTLVGRELAGSACKQFLRAFRETDFLTDSNVVVDAMPDVDGWIPEPAPNHYVNIHVPVAKEDPFSWVGVTLMFDRMGTELYITSVDHMP